MKSVFVFSLRFVGLLVLSLQVLAGTTHLTVPNYDIRDNTAYPISVGSGMLFLTDPDHTYDIGDFIENDFEWKTINRRSPNFGFTTTAYWFRFSIQNHTTTEQAIYIELPIPFLDDVRLYQIQNNEIIHHNKVGDGYLFADRPIHHQNLVMPYTLLPGENEMIMRVAAEGTIEAPLYIWSPETFHVNSNNQQLLQGIWVGIIAIMVLYNLFLYFYIRDKSYLYYILFAGSFLMFQLTLRGYSFAYLWPEQLTWNSFAISPFIALSNLGAAMLVIHYLKLEKHSPSSYRVMKILASVSLLMFFLSFVAPYAFTIRMNSAIAVVSCALSFFLGFVFWQKGDHNARYFAVAWSAAIVGIAMLAGIKFGIIVENYWTSNADQIGIIGLICMLSIALAKRFDQETDLRLKAQESALMNEKIARQSQDELLRSKENANEELERKVEERTETLQQALAELENANSRLEILSTTDSLTTLFNRGHFEKRIDIEFKRANRHGRNLSLIICDIDHFKSINDNYGHKAGDESLRSIALVLKNRIIRSGDLIARYGGEEFIILLVDTPLNDAIKLAQSLCDEISASPINTDGKAITMTASFGVSSLSQGNTENAEQLIHHADVALYRAKNEGRNQVQKWSPATDN